MRDGDHLSSALGDGEPVTVSLRGATASMLMIDDRQWRIGTVTALARPGDAPAASVAAPPDAPAVAALPIRALDPPPALPEGVAAADDPGCEDVEAMAFDLGGGATLWGACDFAGGLQHRLPFLGRRAGWRGAGGVRRAGPARRRPGAADRAGLAADGLGHRGGGPRPRRRRLRRGEPLGLDRRRASRWSGSPALDTCAGVSPDDWPVLWRAR